ncbi:hypothetical protein APHAL10511_004655 [Amanita phalloides]|nr:hypothetical protein APHAL10511_004655 [Amanita phalloides]
MDTRAPPPQGPPPSYAFVTKVYRSSLRPVVIFTTFIGGLWALVSSISYFRNLSVDRTHDVPKLAVYSIALGAVYMGVFGIQLLGFISATLNRTPLVRTYAYASIIAALAVAGAGILDIIVHFTLKNDIINVCSQLTKGNELIYYGFFGPVYHTVINASEAQQYCTNLWNHDSWTDIIAFLLTTFLATLFCSIAFGYLHQLNDPTSPVNSARAPSSQARMSGFPLYYNPPYNGYNNGPHPYGGQPYGEYRGPQGRDGNGATGPYAPPPGPPPNQQERDDPFVPPDDSKPPSYGGHGWGMDDKDEKDDPFEPPREERDVTSRPATGRRDRF